MQHGRFITTAIAAVAAMAIGPAGAATQVGAGATALMSTGVGASQALDVSVSLGALGVLSGTAIFLFAIAWRMVDVSRGQRRQVVG